MIPNKIQTIITLNILLSICLVAAKGLEPSIPFGRRILSPTCMHSITLPYIIMAFAQNGFRTYTLKVVCYYPYTLSFISLQNIQLFILWQRTIITRELPLPLGRGFLFHRLSLC